uniref:Methyltransferase type 11 domain-containing protein n=1 Tax=viral metagenome TaxID=1070528 RepID=A0A6C0DAI0_9ZZZZ
MDDIKIIYNAIANEFNRTRGYMWTGVKQFLDSIPTNSTVLELGSGNGKNMLYRKDLNFTGIDISIEQVKICISKGLNVTEGNITNLLFEDNKFDYIICIATYHHLDNDIDRKKSLDEMYRCLKPDGKILISVWAMEQPEYSRNKFSESDTYVTWKHKYKRYYHIYKEGQLEEEINRLNNNFTIEYIFLEEGNWYICLRK